MTEEWRPIPGFGLRYDVSNQGRVRSWLPWRGRELPHQLHIGDKGTKGHRMVILRPARVSKRKAVLIHRAVLAAFVGPCPEGMEVRHLDGDPNNNRVENLTYGTRSENELDKIRHGTHFHASKTHCKRGHEFTEENTRRNAKGYRWCRECQRQRYRRAA